MPFIIVVAILFTRLNHCNRSTSNTIDKLNSNLPYSNFIPNYVYNVFSAPKLWAAFLFGSCTPQHRHRIHFSGGGRFYCFCKVVTSSSSGINLIIITKLLHPFFQHTMGNKVDMPEISFNAEKFVSIRLLTKRGMTFLQKYFGQRIFCQLVS
jgi:hypothetical protein